jgi:molybdopterin-guanine dinucleotide biosynthesis protein A
LDVRVVADEQEGRGPLQGLAAGLAALPGQTDAAFVSSCDVPLLRPAFVRRMIDLIGDADVCVPRIDGRPHPLAAVYRVNVLDAARALLLEDRRRLMDLFERVPTRLVDANELRDADPTLESLININTPQEYDKALRVIESASPAT